MVDLATFCGNCGAPGDAADKFCRKCGNTFSDPIVSTDDPTNSNTQPLLLTRCPAWTGKHQNGRCKLSGYEVGEDGFCLAHRPHVSTLDHGAISDALRPQHTNGFAVAAMVLGIVGIGGFGGLLALVFGYKARKQIDESNGEQTGRGMATAGIVLGWVWIVALIAIVVIGIVAAVGGPVRKRVGTGSTPGLYSWMTTPTTPWNPPYGYEEVAGSPGFAYRFVANVNNIVCDPGTTCWNVRVISRNGCSSGITINLTVEDSHRTAIGTATDTFTGALRPGQAALLKPGTTNPLAATDTAEVSSISGADPFVGGLGAGAC